MNAWIRSQDPAITEADLVTDHPLYFALQDVRPMAITAKLNQRAQDAYDFAAHTNPATTHKNYDRRRVKRASATEQRRSNVRDFVLIFISRNEKRHPAFA